MRVLVTGADGFIGSHLTEALVRAGHDVRAFVLYNSFNSRGWLDRCAADVAGKFEVFAGDVRDPRPVPRLQPSEIALDAGARECVVDNDLVPFARQPVGKV